MPVRYAGSDNRITYGKTPIKSIMQGETAVYGEDIFAKQPLFTYSETQDSVTITGLTDLGKTRENIIVPSEYNGKAVTSIGYEAFRNCTALKTVTIPDSVTNIWTRAFDNCTSLTSIIIGNSMTSIGWSAFGRCIALTSIIIPDSVTSIGSYAFEACINLTSVTFIGTITQWHTITKGTDWNRGCPFTEVVCSDGTVSV